ncbi:MAG: hypothetical protein ABR874_06190 [Candidatus Sulfotelmatobacter sp.]|jgi:hypothetical protein
MPAANEDIVAVRHEMWNLLQQQMDTLNTPSGLTDNQLIECLERQSRVQELRERLEALNGLTKADQTPDGIPVETAFESQTLRFPDSLPAAA